MKIPAIRSLWRGRNGRLWRLAERLEHTAQAIRYANKPHDLVFPLTVLTDLIVQIREMMWEWLESILKFNAKERGRWPRL